MKWVVNTKDTEVQLNELELLDILFNKLIVDSKDSNREDFDALTKVFADFMQERRALLSTNVEQLLCMSMTLGYFYRVFLEKNEVQKVGENNDKPIRENDD